MTNFIVDNLANMGRCYRGATTFSINVVLSAVMLNVIMLNVIMLNVNMLNVIMLNVIMLNIIMLSVVAPYGGVNIKYLFRIFLLDF